MELTKSGKQKESTQLFGAKREEVDMSIDMSNMAHIVRLLTDLYPQPIQATVREVISNAIDTTNRLPEEERKEILVHLPTTLNLEFEVTDFGEGMDKDTLLSVFAQYGASTKGNDFTQIGAYGLGAKAPLSYASKFTVVSTKDGITTEIFLTTKNTGNVCEVISEKETGKPNGTTVTVPVLEDDIDKFKESSESYEKYALKNDIVFVNNRSEYKNKKDLIFFGEIPVAEHNGESVNVDVYFKTKRKELNDETRLIELINRYGGTFSSYGLTYRYLLSGWDYGNNVVRNSIHSDDLYLDLKPGMVNFSSSRDEITNDERKQEFSRKVSGSMKSMIKEEARKLIKKFEFSVDKLIEFLLKNQVSYDSAKEFLVDVYTSEEVKKNMQRIINSGEIDFFNIIKRQYLKKGSEVALGYNKDFNSFEKYLSSSQSSGLKHNKKEIINEYILAEFINLNKEAVPIVVTDVKSDIIKLNQKMVQYLGNIGQEKHLLRTIAYTENKEADVNRVLKDRINCEIHIVSEEDFLVGAKPPKTAKKKPSESKIKIFEVGDNVGTERCYSFQSSNEKKLAELAQSDNRKILFILDNLELTKNFNYLTQESVSEFIYLINKENKNKEKFYVSLVSRTSLNSKNIEVIADTYDLFVELGNVNLTKAQRELLSPMKIEDLLEVNEPNSFNSLCFINYYQVTRFNEIKELEVDGNKFNYGEKTKHFISLLKKKSSQQFRTNKNNHKNTELEAKISSDISDFFGFIPLRKNSKYVNIATQIFLDNLEENLANIKD